MKYAWLLTVLLLADDGAALAAFFGGAKLCK
jgi:hypothetical protein